MAKKDNSSDYRSIISSVRNHNFAPIYVLMGEETYYIDLIADNIEGYALAEDERDFNQHIFYGNDSDIKTVMAAAQQFPVMSDKKLVMLKEAQTMFKAKEAIEQLAAYANNPNRSTILVIVYKGGTLNATSKFLKAASANDGVVFNSPLIRDYQLVAHVKDFCSSNKIKIEEKALSLMIDYIGLPLSKFIGELNKLVKIKTLNNSTNSVTINAEDVEQNIGISKEFNNFELTRALSEKNYAKCIRIINYFEKNPKSNPGVMVSAALASFFSRLILAHYSDKSDSTLQQLIGFNSTSAVRELKMAMSNFTAMQAVLGLHHVRDFDAKSKGIGSLQNEYLLLKELIFKVFTS